VVFWDGSGSILRWQWRAVVGTDIGALLLLEGKEGVRVV
jgi:hypothetical protein